MNQHVEVVNPNGFPSIWLSVFQVAVGGIFSGAVVIGLWRAQGMRVLGVLFFFCFTGAVLFVVFNSRRFVCRVILEPAVVVVYQKVRRFGAPYNEVLLTRPFVSGLMSSGALQLCLGSGRKFILSGAIEGLSDIAMGARSAVP
jgi:hypothetical protein